MNIRNIQELLSRIDEIKVIGKKIETNKVVYNVAGIVRYGQKLRLIIIEYDEEYRDQIEEQEIAEICNIKQEPETNRIRMKRIMKNSQPFMFIKSVSIGDRRFEVSSIENKRLNIQDGESILFLSELLRNGWNPEGVDYQNMDMLFLTSIELNGDFTEIPDFESKQRLHFIMSNNTKSYVVEQPITLTVNGEYTDKLWFENNETGEKHWVQINDVYLNDMWSEMEKIFTNPKLLNQMTKEEISKSRIDFEEKLLEICPKGMCYPVIEYECEENISLEFHTKKHLESIPVISNYSMGFTVRTEKPTGILGMKLKAAIIQEPMPIDTVNIEAELFQFYKTITLDDIII